MHRIETDRNLTPTTSQMIKGMGATGPMTGAPPLEQPPAGMDVVSSARERKVRPIRSETGLNVEAQGTGRRWTSFEEKLRQRREEIIAGCRYCSTQTSGERLSARERNVG